MGKGWSYSGSGLELHLISRLKIMEIWGSGYSVRVKVKVRVGVRVRFRVKG